MLSSFIFSKVGIEGDIAYHRAPGLGITVNTIIFGVGPRFARGTGLRNRSCMSWPAFAMMR
jgi:hypothetical protein